MRDARATTTRRGLPLGELAYVNLREWILDGTIAPGSDLREVDLARRLKTSRTPVREALLRLSTEGLIHRNAAGGYSLSEFRREDLAKVYEVREALEALAAGLAAANRSRAQLGRLADVIEASEHAVARRDHDALGEHEGSFHEAIFEASGNGYLKDILDGIHAVLVRYRPRSELDANLRVELHKQHYAILEAITAQDAPEAERLVHEHIRHALDMRLRAMETKRSTAETKRPAEPKHSATETKRPVALRTAKPLRRPRR